MRTIPGPGKLEDFFNSILSLINLSSISTLEMIIFWLYMIISTLDWRSTNETLIWRTLFIWVNMIWLLLYIYSYNYGLSDYRVFRIWSISCKYRTSDSNLSASLIIYERFDILIIFKETILKDVIEDRVSNLVTSFGRRIVVFDMNRFDPDIQISIYLEEFIIKLHRILLMIGGSIGIGIIASMIFLTSIEWLLCDLLWILWVDFWAYSSSTGSSWLFNGFASLFINTQEYIERDLMSTSWWWW
jgi:hypothetical protein